MEIPVPTPVKKKRGRGPKKSAKPVNSLTEALRFLASIQKNVGPIEFTHCRLFNRQAIATNGVQSVGCAIDDYLEVCPHTQTFFAAMEKAPGPVNLSVLTSGSLSVLSEDFQARIAACDSDALPVIAPDAATHIADNRLTLALKIVGELVSDTAQTLLTACIQLRSNSALATNNEVILEAWHGLNLPTGLLIPKSFVTALLKIDKAIVSFGNTDNSLTVYFVDNSWLKTMLFPPEDSLPVAKIDEWLNFACNPFPVPIDFFQVVNRLAPFSADNKITFNNSQAKVVGMNEIGAIEDIGGVPDGIAFSIKNLAVIQPYVKQIAFGSSSSHFFGVFEEMAICRSDSLAVRGVIINA